MKITSTKKFDKKIRKQSSKVKKEFIKRIFLFEQDSHTPLLNTHKLTGEYKGLWSFNLSGDIRVIFDSSEEGVVILLDIGTRSELYG
jgi:addiction module RelE/StbE family toxin